MGDNYIRNGQEKAAVGKRALPEGVGLSGRESVPGISDPINDIPGRPGAPVQHTSLCMEGTALWQNPHAVTRLPGHRFVPVGFRGPCSVGPVLYPSAHHGYPELRPGQEIEMLAARKGRKLMATVRET